MQTVKGKSDKTKKKKVASPVIRESKENRNIKKNYFIML